MTKAALQALINELGDKLKIIKGTNFAIYLNHAKSAETLSNSDIEFKSYGGIDFIVFKELDGIAQKPRTVYAAVSDVTKVIAVDSDVYDPYRT